MVLLESKKTKMQKNAGRTANVYTSTRHSHIEFPIPLHARKSHQFVILQHALPLVPRAVASRPFHGVAEASLVLTSIFLAFFGGAVYHAVLRR